MEQSLKLHVKPQIYVSIINWINIIHKLRIINDDMTSIGKLLNITFFNPLSVIFNWGMFTFIILWRVVFMLVGDVVHNGHPFCPLQFPIIITRWSCPVAMVCNGLDPWSNLVSIHLLWCCFQFFGNAYMTKVTDLRNCEIKCLAFSIHVINWNFSVSNLLQCATHQNSDVFLDENSSYIF